ncbi:MAG: alpha/beta fold hydrolase [Myxococcota bacterium]|nr:alpha/beta fold hydrolase [Myxococcota bacterium]
MAQPPDPPRPGFVTRLAAAVQNGLEIARFGGLAEREPSPYEVAAEEAHHRLRHYFPADAGPGRPPALLIPPLMLTAEVWDVAPESSAVAALHASDIDPWVVDFGSPEHEEGGLERTLTDHVLAVSRSIEAVREATGQDVHVMGYSQGGMFAYQAAAYRRSQDVASVVVFGSPVDMRGAVPPLLPPDLVVDAVERLSRVQSSLFPSGIPSWATRLGFQLMDPVKTVQQRVEFARQLYDREALQQREGMRRFLGGEGWVAFPGPALRDAMEQFFAQNRLLQGGLVIDDRTVTLADLTCPILVFVGKTDTLAPPPTVRAIEAAAPRADSYQISIPAGHFGLVVGSRSTQITWPSVAEWVRWREGKGSLPERARRIEPPREHERGARTALDGLRDGAGIAWGLGRDLLGGASRAMGSRVGVLGRFTGAVVPQLPHLARLSELRSDTRTSIGLALQERAEASPEDTFFLFDDRAHPYEAANVRVDNIVRGLLHCGVRQGEHVGLLMDTRPSAVAATVALSRLGAVTVLLRPDLPLARQLDLAPVDHLLADPEHAEAAHEASGRPVLVLGGGGEPRALAPGLIDMEAIDPDRVFPPDWYVPNPALADDLALVLITGDDERPRASRVTNRRWATSAYGTASGCALTPRDTVYCCSPIHHATGILVCVGGALMSGARLAMARRFDPRTFWDDVRRYGVSVVFYSGTLCSALVNAPDDPAERSHPVRLFAGSGMPKGIWKRMLERFRPARVVEFFASTEGNAVLVNLTGEKVGSVGRPLPGGAELALAAWDLERGQRVQRSTGFAVRCRQGDVGLLLAKVDQERVEPHRRPLRSVFEPGDAWLDTGDLVRCDREGDYWLVDHVADVIHTRRGAVPTHPVEDTLSDELDFVDLVAVYGATLPEQDDPIPVAALTLRAGHKLDPRALRRAVERHLASAHRPLVVRVLDELPMTAGHRVRKRPLRADGLGLATGSGETLWLAPGADAYEPFARADLLRLAAAVRNAPS